VLHEFAREEVRHLAAPTELQRAVEEVDAAVVLQLEVLQRHLVVLVEQLLLLTLHRKEHVAFDRSVYAEVAKSHHPALRLLIVDLAERNYDPWGVDLRGYAVALEAGSLDGWVVFELALGL